MENKQSIWQRLFKPQPVVNQDITTPIKNEPVGELFARIKPIPTQRKPLEMDDFIGALVQAESYIQPNRTRLWMLLNQAVLDPHLFAVMEKRTQKVIGKDWVFVNEAGEKDIEASKQLWNDWFVELLRYAMDSIYYGYVLVELTKAVKNQRGELVFEQIRKFPNINVFPEYGSVRTGLEDAQGITYRDENGRIIFPRVFEIGGHRDLGLVTKAMPFVIAKRLSLSQFIEYNQRAGIPFRFGTTDLTNQKRAQDFAEMMQNLGSASWGVGHNGAGKQELADKVEFIDTSAGQDGEGFDRLINLADAQISKLILGNTLTTDSGKSGTRAQGNVHREAEDDVTNGDCMMVKNFLNNKLLPLMDRDGFMVKGLRFDYIEEEEEDLLMLAQRDEILQRILTTQNLTIDPEYFSDKYGVPVLEKESDVGDDDDEEGQQLQLGDDIAKTAGASRVVTHNRYRSFRRASVG
jgi:phage gp29-like protein